MRAQQAVCFLVCCGILAGCSGGPKPIPTSDVSGEVKRMSGEPMGKVKVVFYPTKGPSSVATTDDAGKFTAKLPLGECKVAVVSGGEAKSPDMSPKAAAEAAKADTKVPPRYASPDSSGLTIKVQDKQTEKAVLIVQEK